MDDIQTLEGYTMSSDPKKFGVVDDGSYTVKRLKPGERKGPYNSDCVIESRTAKIPAKGALNPTHPERDPAYLTQNIHKKKINA